MVQELSVVLIACLKGPQAGGSGAQHWGSPTGMGFCSSPTCKNSVGNGEAQAHTDTQNLPPVAPRETVSIPMDAIEPARDIWSVSGQQSPLCRAKALSCSGSHALISFPYPSF